jgi:hypothetical protein
MYVSFSLTIIYVIFIMVFQCEGCNAPFGREGDLIQHLQKSQGLLCIAARHTIEAKMRPPVKGNQPQAKDVSDEEIGPVLIGYFFHMCDDYTDADFPFPDQSELSGSSVDPPSNINEPEMEVDEPETDTISTTAPGGLTIEDHNSLRSPPSHVTYFGGKAGMPIANSNPQMGYHGYNATLGASQNKWAPFESRIDWEIAQWAKLRGPGSTAFSELLSIEGVRHHEVPHFYLQFKY